MYRFLKRHTSFRSPQHILRLPVEDSTDYQHKYCQIESMGNLLKRDGQLPQYQSHQWVAEIVNAIVRARVVDQRYNHVTIAPCPVF